MSFVCLFMMLLGSSVMVVAFVLQPSEGESHGSVTTAGFHQSCHGMSLQSIKNDLLRSLRLETEPQLPVGLAHSVREQWKQAFSELAQQAGAPAESHSASFTFGNGNTNSLKCCSVACEVFFQDLGWSNWVIYPLSLTITQCKVCSAAGKTGQLPQASIHHGQVPCCHPTSQKTVPIAYMDGSGSVMVSSVQLTTGCGCATDTNPQLINK